MEKIFRGRRGFTVPELLIAALLSMIVLAALYGFYHSQLSYLLSQEAKAAALEDARGALDIMVRELRNAGSWTSGTQPPDCQKLVAATPTTIRIQADLNGDGDCDGATQPAETGEDVTYSLVAGPTAVCPGPNRVARNTQCLLGNVVLPTGSSLFTYYDSSGTQLAGSPPISGIKRVKITLSVQVSSRDPKVSESATSALTSSVELRN